MSPQLVLHPRVADPGTLRVWLAAVDVAATPELEWLLDRVPAVPTVRRELAPVQPVGGTPGALRSRTGIFEFGPLDPGSQHRVEVRATGTPLTSGELVTRLLPDRVPGADQPAGFDAGFSIMIVSCYDQATDKQGRLGVVLSQLPADRRPDLVILMGDQVYLDNPVLTLPHVTVDPLAAAFEDKYLRNWTTTPPQTHGYADLLDLAPVVAIPDDHDYWNNFPFPFAAAPGTWADGGHGPWTAAANALLDAFQRDVAGEHSRVVDVDPLSIFLMDNRTDRTTHYDRPTTSASDHTLFDGWVQGLVDGAQRGDDTVPVLVTGPSLLQPAKGRLARTLDANLTNYDDYRWIMGQVQRLQQAGRPVMLLTGDVHYPRIAQADGGLVGDGELLEVISSPSSLVGIPGLDQAAGLAGRVSRLFGGHAGLRWPQVRRLADPDNAPPISPQPAYRDVYPDGRPGEVGDHVALLTFRRDDPAVRVSATYLMVPKPDNPDVARVGVDAGTFTLTPAPHPDPGHLKESTMLNVTSSSAVGETSTVDEVARRSSGRETRSNLGWLRRQLTPDLSRLRGVATEQPSPTLVILLGGIGHSAFRVRVAQSHLRHDLWPSHWSHALLVDPHPSEGVELGVYEVPLEQGEDTDSVPERNGVRRGSFARYDDPTAYPNVAVLQIPVSADSWALPQGDRESLIALFRRQRSVLDAPELLVAWLSFVWGTGTVGNPLLAGVGLPCSAMIETVLSAARFDISPGVDSRLSCPEAFWQSAKWWSRFYAEQGKEAIAGRYTVTDRIGDQPPSEPPGRSAAGDRG